MTDPIEEYAKRKRMIDAQRDTVESAISQAEGVRSTLGGIGGGGFTDATSERYVSLLESADRLLELWEGLDDERQRITEIADMLEEDDRELVLMALTDAQVHGNVSRARIARKLGLERHTVSKRYRRAVDSLNATGRQHGGA